VSEVTTSNNLETTELTAVVKIEAQSPKLSNTMESIGINSTQNGANIPVGIAVARQRLQETTTTHSPQLQATKELNRFSFGMPDFGE
jgi:hypothetical protein